MTGGQRPEGSEGGETHVDIWGNRIPGGGSSTCKGPEAAGAARIG